MKNNFTAIRCETEVHYATELMSHEKDGQVC